jgi:tetratricopeptide (TPR) repeat protein
MWTTRPLDRIMDWWETRRALRDARAAAKAEVTAVLEDPEKNPLELAEVSLRLGDRDQALRHWRDAFNRFPDHVGRSHRALWTALNLGLLDEAESLALRSAKRKPWDPVYAEQAAEAMHLRGEFAEVLPKWDRIRRRFPMRTMAYTRIAMCFGRLGREDEVEPFLEAAVRRFPDLIDCRIDFARWADQRGDWQSALERWTWMEEHFPHFIEGVLRSAHALEQLGRADEAEARLRAARHRHPAHPEMAIALARHAARRRSWEEAAREWELIRERWPAIPDGYLGGADALLALGRSEEAEQVRAMKP